MLSNSASLSPSNGRDPGVYVVVGVYASPGHVLPSFLFWTLGLGTLVGYAVLNDYCARVQAKSLAISQVKAQVHPSVMSPAQAKALAKTLKETKAQAEAEAKEKEIPPIPLDQRSRRSLLAKSDQGGIPVQVAIAPYLPFVLSSGISIWLSVLGGVFLVVLPLAGYLLLHTRTESIAGKTVLTFERNSSGDCLVLWEGKRRIPLHPEDRVLAKKVDGQKITAVCRQPGADYQTIVLANGRQLRLAPGAFFRERALKPSSIKIRLGHSVRRR